VFAREFSQGSLLALQFPEFEIVVVSDGAEDGTMDQLIGAFALAEQPWASRQDLSTSDVRRTYRSLTHPNLIVVDKERGGKADALNAGLNMARYPLFAAVDADSLLDGEAILRASRLFVEDETVAAVGGTIRPLNHTVIEDGRITEARIPKKWLERFQVLEYARAFLTGRAGWSHSKSLLIISRGLRVVPAHGGPGGRRLPGRHRGRGHGAGGAVGPGHPAPPAQPLAPGLWETLWIHKDMLLNPRYKRLGLVAVPYFWLFEALAPLVEISGYVLVVVGIFAGSLGVKFARAHADAVLVVAGAGLASAAGARTRAFGRAHVPGRMAVYEWHQAGELPDNQVTQRLRFVRANGFRTVYLEVGDYLDAAELAPGTPGRQALLPRIRRQIQRFVGLASDAGVAVQALGGGPAGPGSCATWARSWSSWWPATTSRWPGASASRGSSSTSSPTPWTAGSTTRRPAWPTA
jgi:hypothetical protein